MSTPDHAAAPDALLRNLADALATQEALAGLVEARTDALRHADAAGMAAAERAEGETLREAVRLEKQRRSLTAELATPLGLDAEATLAQLAAATPEPTRERLLAARSALREAVERNGRRATRAARAATTTAAHVEGLLRRITERSTGGTRYGATGRHAPARGSLSSMSLVA